MKESPTIILIADANILIDLSQARALVLLRLLSEHGLAEIQVPRCVFDEIEREVSENELLELGVHLIPVPLTLQYEVLQIEARSISTQDKVVALIATNISGAVWTNDRALRRYCQSTNIVVYYEFEILFLLFEEDLITKRDLLEVAERVEAVNPMMKRLKLVEKLTGKLEEK